MQFANDPIIEAIENAAACQTIIRARVRELLARHRSDLEDEDYTALEDIVTATWRAQQHLAPIRPIKKAGR